MSEWRTLAAPLDAPAKVTAKRVLVRLTPAHFQPLRRVARWHALCSKIGAMSRPFSTPSTDAGGRWFQSLPGSRRKPSASLCTAALLALGLAASAAPAAAQTVELNQTTGFKIERDPERSSGEFPLKLNRDDCLNDSDNTADDPRGPGVKQRTLIEITPKLTKATTSMSLEVWVGTASADCTDRAQRQSVTGRCNKVFSTTTSVSGQTFVIHPRDVIEALSRTNEGGKDLQGVGTRDSCSFQTETAVGYYVMLLTNGDVVGTTAKWDKSPIDTRAPDPPGTVDVTAGDGLLFPEWEIPESAVATDTLGFRFYCEPIGGGATGGSGNAGEGGAGGATAAATGCSAQPSRLIAGALPDDLAPLLCGVANGITTRSGQVTRIGIDERTGSGGTRLQNGVEYAVAIATVDQVSNKGKLSPATCGTPEEVTTFFESYRDEGGRGGGGFCGFSPRPSSPLAILGSLAVATWMIRRRAQNRSRAA